MKYSAQVVVSHTHMNPLNYLYFDLAYMGYPILHNGYMCSDIGYFYEENNFEMAANTLNEILESHDQKYEEYRESNRLYLDKYMPHNKLLQHKYKKLIDELLI